MNKDKQKKVKDKVVDKNKKLVKPVKTKKTPTSSKVSKKRRDYFGIIFVSVSILMFLLLAFLLSWFKNSLFLAKDLVEIEKVINEENPRIIKTDDPLLSIRNNPELEEPISSNLDPVLGEYSADKLKIFYFSDFECSFCLEQIQAIRNIFNKYQDKITVTWKDYPDIRDKKDFSYQAARAARCAQAQDSFWVYSDLIYKEIKRTSQVDDDFFTRLAGQAKLNLNSFVSCLNNNQVDSLILSNVLEAEDLGILGIPYIYINGKDFLGNLSQEELEEIVEEELEEIAENGFKESK